MITLEDISPAARWLSGYDTSDFGGDLAAGLTVGVMLIPQSMAYAMLAGMPPIYGLYASLIPLLVYPFLGSSRHLAVGVSAVNMIIVATGVGGLVEGPAASDKYIQYVILLTAMTGVLEIGMAILRFGFMANFLSRPVIAGFMTAAPIIIVASQLGSLLGVDLEGEFPWKLWEAAERYAEIDPVAAGLGVAGIAILLTLQAWKPRWPAALLWVVLASVVSWGFGLADGGLATVAGISEGPIPAGFPSFQVVHISWDAVGDLAPTAVTLALVQFMMVMSLGEAFASEHDYTIEANRELFAIGMSNLVGSFFRSIPVTGSFSRSAVNERAGAETPLANVFASALVGLTLLFLTPLFRFLPIPALASIIMVACVGMIDVPELKALLQTRWLDGAIALITFGATLFIGIQEGILLGVGMSIAVVLYEISQPNVVELGHLPGTQEFRDLERNPNAEEISGLHIMRIDSRFSFANAKVLKEELLEKVEDGSMRALIIDASGINDVDTTAEEAIRDVVEELSDHEVEFYVVGAKGPVRDMMRRSGLHELIGEENFFLNSHQAVKHLLEKWDREESYGPIDEAEKRKEEIDEARETLKEERARLQRERRDLTSERDRLEREIADHLEQRDALDIERDRLQDELEEAKQRRDELREEREEIEEQREELEDELDELEDQQEQIQSERQELEERQEELQEERQRMSAERKRLEAEREKYENSSDDEASDEGGNENSAAQ
ncbi:MAG: sulfate permease [Bradymonadaceae bacterium]